ncbi:protein ELYS isoform X2 [Leucoraja erinacea]|uniref:protein ELYS isoform X2 n=1 Tax=Leucoraja erinaceus TaxID=7782 RepID=UPI0024546F8C|nr:protein ELYS isoform X2 [Leucoraja erinacea]
MCELTAQVTSSLLQFPEVTIEALGDDETAQDVGLYGKIATGRNGLSWLACGAHLELLNSITGERLSAYRFCGIGEQPPTILAVKEFCWLKRTGLLIGLKESEGSILCLYDLSVSRVVKAVFLPGKVTGIEPIVNHGGATASTQRLNQSLRWFFGIVAVVTDTGHVLLIDLCLDDFSCSQSEQEPADLEVVNGSPAEIPRMRENVMREGRHLCFQLQNPSGIAATAVRYVLRTNHLVVGFANGYVQLWNLKTLKQEYCSQLEGGNVPVYAFTFQEPENDPRNCCYLWAVQSAQDGEGDVVSLHLLQLAFGDRKCLTSGQILYEGLEYCEERYTQDLTYEVLSSRTRNTNARLLGCQTLEKFRNHADREESVAEATSPDTSVSVFSWQVNTYGQRKPSTYLGIFDINRWYHAQMPDSLRAGEKLGNCPYFALWSLDAVVNMTFPYYLLDVIVHERSLSRGVPPSYPPPEQFFNPSTYNFDATCLLNTGVVHITGSGFQKETLNYLKKVGPFLSEAIPDGYSRCLMAGLLSPRLADVQPSCLSQEEKLEAILSAAVESSSLGLITGCIKQWTTEEQPRSAASLRFVLEWTWKKITRTKEELDNICISLFDGSCHFIDSHTLQSLQHCQMLLSNLTTIVSCFLTEAQELTERGLVDLMNKRIVGTLLSQYAQIVLWFCRAGLLPEGSDDADLLQLSRPIYNYPVIQNYYTNRRHKLERLSKGKWCSDCLLIDGMVSETGDNIEQLWKKDEGGTGKYPPSTLHALLDVYLLENVDETTKHAIAIYLLLDVLSSAPNKNESSIESFPPAFAIPVGLVNLIQGFWLLDHNDHENGLDRILHPATSRSLSSWQHVRIIQALMCQGEYRKALRYMQAMKPSMTSSSEVKLHLTVLLFNSSMVEAWHLLRLNANRINVEDLLRHMYELCQENGLMEELLKLPFTGTEQDCLEKFLKNSGNLQNQEFLLVHHLQRANYVPALQLNQSLKASLNDHDPQIRERTAARNSILEQYGKVLPTVQRKLATERIKPYHHFATLREVKRPKPLSTVARQSTSGGVTTRATFINSVLSKVNEVWLKNMQGATLSPFNSPKCSEQSSVDLVLKSTEVCDAFVGTPIKTSSRKISRLLDSMRQLKSHTMLKEEPPRCEQIKTNSSWMTNSPLQSRAVRTGHLGCISKASELKLLQTPPVVKRARAFTASEPTFASFAPQSILRSNLRPTPMASPCASPSRSSTPPLRAKETKICFVKEKQSIRWTGDAAADELQLPRLSKRIPRTPSIESWPSTPENLVASELSPDNGVLFERVEVVNLSGTDKDASKDDVDSSGRTEDWSMEEYVDAAESLDRGDTSKDREKTVSVDELIFNKEERIISCDRTTVDAVDRDVTSDQDVDISQSKIEEVLKNEKLFHVDNEQHPFECEEVLEIDKNENTSLLVNDATEFMGSSSEEAVLPAHNLITSDEGETMHPETSEEQVLSPIPGEKKGLVQDEDSLLPSTSDTDLDEEDVPRTESRNEKNESALSGYKESDVKMMDDVAECTQNESLAILIPVNTQFLQNVNDGLEVDAPVEESCSTVAIELKEYEPVVFGTVLLAGERDIGFPDQSNDKASEVEGDEVCVTECHNMQENMTLILKDGNRDEAVEQLTLTEVKQKAALFENRKAVLFESLETKISESINENPENYAFESEENLCIKHNYFILEPLEDDHKVADPLPCVSDPIKVNITHNLTEVLKGGELTDNSTEVFKAGESIDNSTEVLKGGQSTDNSTEVLEGRLTDNSKEVLKEGKPIDNSKEVLKEGQATDYLTEVLKEGQLTDNSTEVLEGQPTDNSTKVLAGQRTDNLSEVLEGQPTDNSTEVLEGQPTDNSTEVLNGGQPNEEKMSEFIKSPILVDTGITKKRNGLRKRESMEETDADESEELNRKVVQSKQIEAVVMPTRSLRGKSKVGEISSLDNEELVLVEIQKVKPKIKIPVTPRRSTRRTVTGMDEIVKNNVEEHKGIPLDQKTDSLHTTTTTRSTRKSNISRTHDAEANMPHLVMLPILKSTRRSVAIRADTELILDSSMRTPLHQKAEVISISQRSSRQKRKKLSDVGALLDNSLSKLEINEHIPVVPTPIRLTRSRAKGAHLVALENIAELTSNIEVTLPVKSDNTRRRQHVTNKETIKPVVKDDIVDDRQEEQLTVTFTHKPTRRKSGKDSELHPIILAEEDSYAFSPPLTRSSRKLKVEKPTLLDSPVQQPEFLFSTPLTRSSRRTNKAPLQTVKEKDLDILEDDVPKIKEFRKEEVEKSKQGEKVCTRSRTTRLRMKKSPRVTKKASWSAPPVEIKFLSPLASPLDSLSGKRKEAEDDAGSVEHKMTLRHKRKKLIPMFRKPVTRRKVNRPL